MGRLTPKQFLRNVALLDDTIEFDTELSLLNEQFDVNDLDDIEWED